MSKKESKSGLREMKHSLIQLESLEIQYPMQVKQMSEQETKEYHLKRLQKLSEDSLGNIPYLHEPTDEQKEWVLDRLKQPTKYWQRWFVSQYFTREQKALMGLTDKDIAGKGIK